jgi:hypothetical protein
VEDKMQKQRRWLKAAIIASAVPQPPLPWTRSQRVAPMLVRGVVTVAAQPTPLNQK